MAARKRAFVLAFVLIAAGFALQIAGAWSGCPPRSAQ